MRRHVSSRRTFGDLRGMSMQLRVHTCASMGRVHGCILRVRCVTYDLHIKQCVHTDLRGPPCPSPLPASDERQFQCKFEEMGTGVGREARERTGGRNVRVYLVFPHLGLVKPIPRAREE